MIGRGANYATAFEAALKIKELAGVAAEPASPADFLHGPVAMLDPGFPVLAVLPADPPAPRCATCSPPRMSATPTSP